MIQAILLFLFTSVSDRFRGRPSFIPMQIRRLVEALAIVLCAGVTSPKMIAGATFLLWSGICIGGYGNAIGPAVTGKKPAEHRTVVNPGPEWWQIGFLVRSAYASLLVVAFIWGFPVTLMYMLDMHVLFIPVALMIAFPLSCWSAYLIGESLVRTGDWRWALQQWIFGAITACVLTASRLLF